MRSFHRTFATLVLVCIPAFLHAQTPPDKPAEPAPTVKAVDPKLHADVLELLELTAVKKLVEGSFKQGVEDGQKEMMKRCEQCSPEFGEEWAKRMLARLKADDFVQVYVQAYEKNFTDDEVKELINLQKSRAPGVEAAKASPALQEKLKATLPTMLSEIMGGCTQIGAKLGAEIGSEIEKEHPEYIKAKPAKSDS